jgi:hypothetical protein
VERPLDIFGTIIGSHILKMPLIGRLQQHNHALRGIFYSNDLPVL